MTPEKKVKEQVKRILKEVGAWHCMPATHGYGTSGVPDILACLRGRFIGIECKAGKGVTTALQTKNLNEIVACGGLSIVVNETNYDELRNLLTGVNK